MQVDADRSFSRPTVSTIDENTIDAPRLELKVPHGWAGRLVDPRRVFDIVGTLVLLPFALVLGAITALAIFLDSPGPVFYRSTRVGLGGRTFQMLKFRKFHQAAAGQALTMPILAPLADFGGVDRSLIVTTYNAMGAWLNLVLPINAILIAGLALAKVPFDRYVRFMAPLMGILLVGSILVVFMNIVADILYALADPRIRY